MKILYSFIVALSALCLTGCKATDPIDRQVKTDIENRRQELASTAIFSALDSMDLTADERRAMEFLYAYSPLPDIADRPAEFMLDNVRIALRARQEMPWDVPYREWIHFVVPPRVNNEPLDSARIVLYDELKERIRGLSMADAILEINHWAHEKATYQPSDGRTRSPLQTLRAAIGRCGEESTFLVAALRTVGIPARQVYTPRWAHTDDNHAWVEAWADGKWYFLGACEPEPVLNLGWFNAPASRGMLMSTRVFGHYDGPEEKLDRGEGYTIINVTDNYAPTRSLTVEVTDTAGTPLPGATVRFGLYNYAEFYPLAELTTGADGRASLTTGKGDILLWASDGSDYVFAKASAADTLVNLTPSPSARLAPGEFVDLDIAVPAEASSLPDVTSEQRAINDLRFAREDSVRHAYMASAFLSDSALDLLDSEIRPLAEAMKSNHCLLNLYDLSGRTRSEVTTLLRTISTKDLGDAPYHMLLSALRRPESDIEYVINPRISTEELTPWWEELIGFVSDSQADSIRSNPRRLARLAADSLTLVREQWQPANLHLSPGATWRNRMTDPSGRDIFIVAAARTLGIPSRLNPVTSAPQYRKSDGSWTDFFTSSAEAEPQPMSRLILSYTDVSERLDDPQYYTHFTLSALGNDGLTELLTYDEGSSTARATFASPGAEVNRGDYLLTSGRRLANGNVLARISMIRVDSTATTAPLIVRSSDKQIEVIGSFNSEDRFIPDGATEPTSILSVTGRGYFIIGLIDGSEPSTHALNDLSSVAADLESAGRKIILLAPEGLDPKKRLPASGSLPSTVVWGTDHTGAIASEIRNNMNLSGSSAQLPIFIIADTFNRVVFVSSGYTIGLGHTILDTLLRL